MNYETARNLVFASTSAQDVNQLIQKQSRVLINTWIASSEYLLAKTIIALRGESRSGAFSFNNLKTAKISREKYLKLLKK